jgi:hypothetical protein
MGTNYYLRHRRFNPLKTTTEAVRDEAGCYDGPLAVVLRDRFLAGLPGDLRESLHIGKSSGGWCFRLHVYPEHGINDLDDWKPFLEDGIIFDEYETFTTADTMLRIITERSWDSDPRRYTAATLATNCAQPGPNGLLRSRLLPGHCIGHGQGTWDLMIGDFS